MIELSIPGIGEAEKGAKDRVITLLSEEYPLSLIQLSTKIRRNYNLSITYQAVRKAVEDLVQKGILEKEDKKYKISKEWIVKTKQFLDTLLLHYGSGRTSIHFSPELAKENYTLFTFNNLLDLDIFWGDVMHYWAEHKMREEDIHFIGVGHYAWWILINFGRETKLFEHFKNKGIRSSFFLLKNNALNRWAGKVYQSQGLKVKVKTLEKIEERTGINVMGDTVIQVYYGKKIADKIKKIYERNTDFKTVDIKEITELAHESCEIKFVLFKNASLAKTLRESYLPLFS